MMGVVWEGNKDIRVSVSGKRRIKHDGVVSSVGDEGGGHDFIIPTICQDYGLLCTPHIFQRCF